MEVIRKRTGLGRLLLFLVVVAMSSGALLAAVAANPPTPSPLVSGPMRVASVAVSPADPAPYEPITLTAQLGGILEGAPTVSLQYGAYFATATEGGGAMTRVGYRSYEYVMPGVSSGTEVWVVVAISAANEDPVVSASYTFQVGTVVRGGDSQLQIDNLRHTPANPHSWDTVTVYATVTSRAAIEEVNLEYMAFCRIQRVPIEPPMVPAMGHEFSEVIQPDQQCGFNAGSVYVYRVFAVDATGNTAVSEMGTIRFT